MTKLKYFALGVISVLLVVLIMGAAPTTEKTNKPDVHSVSTTSNYVIVVSPQGGCYRLDTRNGKVNYYYKQGS